MEQGYNPYYVDVQRCLLTCPLILRIMPHNFLSSAYSIHILSCKLKSSQRSNKNKINSVLTLNANSLYRDGPDEV